MATKSKRITSERLLFPYPGSKQKLARHIVPLFPPHELFVSGFAGTGSEFCHKSPSKREIINDIDHNIYAIFAVLRDKKFFRQLLYWMQNSHDCRRLYYECWDKLKINTLSIVERAYCFLVVGNLGYKGVHPATTRSYSCGFHKKTHQLISLLPALLSWRNRMRTVEVEDYDVIDLIDLYDSPKTFFYFDPPYHESTCNGDLYVHGHFDHVRFLKRLQDLEGKALVCGYPFGLYDTQLLGWHRVSFPVTKTIGGCKPRTEVVWMNYDEQGNKLHQDLDLIKAFEDLPE